MYDGVCFCFCCSSVFLLFVVSSDVAVFLSVLVCDPDLFSLNRFMTIKHRYTIVAFTYFSNIFTASQNAFFFFYTVSYLIFQNDLLSHLKKYIFDVILIYASLSCCLINAYSASAYIHFV